MGDSVAPGGEADKVLHSVSSPDRTLSCIGWVIGSAARPCGSGLAREETGLSTLVDGEGFALVGGQALPQGWVPDQPISMASVMA